MRILPRLTYFHARDQVEALTIYNIGFTLLGTNYDYSFTEGSIELNCDVWFLNGLLLQPFLRGTARYDMQRVADTISTINGDDIELERWHGQLRAGLRAQFGPNRFNSRYRGDISRSLRPASPHGKRGRS